MRPTPVVLAVAVLAGSTTSCTRWEPDCYSVKKFRQLNLVDWCSESGVCSYNDRPQACDLNSPDRCAARCQYYAGQGYDDFTSCENVCLTSYDQSCPFLYMSGGNELSWTLPLADLGKEREGLTILDVRLEASAPTSAVQVRIVALGMVQCAARGSDEHWSIDLSCKLPELVDEVRLELVGSHPAFHPALLLREPSPTQDARECETEPL